MTPQFAAHARPPAIQCVDWTAEAGQELARLRESWRMGLAPAGVQAVTIGFDVHPDVRIWSMDGFLDDLPDLGLPDPPKRRARRAPDCVLWTRVRCPFCGSEDCPVYDSSHVPVRYHKCRACGRNLKSAEENWREQAT